MILKKPQPDNQFEIDGRSFADIKRECLEEKKLFEDPEFPADDSSLFFKQKPRIKFVWKRPHVSLNFRSKKLKSPLMYN